MYEKPYSLSFRENTIAPKTANEHEKNHALCNHYNEGRKDLQKYIAVLKETSSRILRSYLRFLTLLNVLNNFQGIQNSRKTDHNSKKFKLLQKENQLPF